MYPMKCKDGGYVFGWSGSSDLRAPETIIAANALCEAGYPVKVYDTSEIIDRVEGNDYISVYPISESTIFREAINLPKGDVGLAVAEKTVWDFDDFRMKEKTENGGKFKAKMAENNEKERRTARREDWKTEPMPEKQETFVLQRHFSDEEMEALRLGNVPQAMEDKWFWYMEGSTLWAHRSWTGFCIYRIDFGEDDHHTVTVNRDPEQYLCSSIEEDTESLNELLDWWIRAPYDHYGEWLSETYQALKKTGK